VTTTILDIAGIGFGPSNLALAIALEECGWNPSRLFLERAPSVNWQEELLLPGSDIQHHALRDLITPVNPRSRFGFLSYLQAHGRLLDFLNLPQHYAYRTDYAAYVRWAARSFEDRVRHHADVDGVRIADGLYEIETGSGEIFRARALVVGTGRSANVPAEFARLPGHLCTHSRSYLSHVRGRTGRPPRRIAVVGASQSAVEILLDLYKRWPETEIYAIQRGYGYQTKDKSPFTHHVYFPKFVDDFFAAPAAVKDDLWAELKRTNYAAADDDVVNELYGLLYEERVRDRSRMNMLSNVTTSNAEATPDGVRIELHNRLDGSERELVVDEVILATGYRDIGLGGARERCPRFLRDLMAEFALDAEGALDVRRDYSVAMRPGAPPLFLNGMCEASHGFGDAGSFSLVSVRAAGIVASLRDRLVPGWEAGPGSKVAAVVERGHAGRSAGELS
jgi:L-ornithine N5-monooxygenase